MRGHRIANASGEANVIADAITIDGGFAFTAEFARGDANSDGYVNISDVTNIQRAVAEMDTLDDLRKKAADVNSDGIIDGRDATAVLSYYAYISTGRSISLIDFVKGGTD